VPASYYRPAFERRPDISGSLTDAVECIGRLASCDVGDEVLPSPASPGRHPSATETEDGQEGAPVKTLELVGGKTYSGDATDKFVEAKLFNFADLKDLYEAPKK
jgi:hypothetical protein